MLPNILSYWIINNFSPTPFFYITLFSPVNKLKTTTKKFSYNLEPQKEL